MNQIVSLAAESIAREKIPHALNVAAGATAATAGVTTGWFSDIAVWLPLVAVIASLMVSCALFYKTYLQIKIAKLQLAKAAKNEEP